MNTTTRASRPIRVKLIRMPYVSQLRTVHGRYTFNTPHFPPISLGLLTAYLRARGIFVDQDDLNIRLYHQTVDRAIELPVLYDEERVLQRLLGNVDPLLDQIVDMLLAETSHKGFDLFGLSLPAGSRVTMGLPFLLANRIKETVGDVPIVLGGGVLRHLDLYGSSALESDFLNVVFRQKKIIDYLVLGAGEMSLSHLIDALYGNGGFEQY